VYILFPGRSFKQDRCASSPFCFVFVDIVFLLFAVICCFFFVLLFDAVVLCVSWPVAYFVAAMSTVGG
jgi:hypothetical protein